MKQKNRCMRKLGFGIFFGIFLSMGVFGSMAETELSSVSVSASYTDWEGGMARIPEFYAPYGCDIDVEWLSSSSSFAPGKTVKAKITLTAEEGYSFKSSTSVYVDYADITNKSISDSEMTIQVKVGPLYYQLDAPEHVAWSSETSPVVKWSKVEYATEYRVRVYQDDSVIKDEIVTGRTYDAGKYFNGDGQLMVSVTALSRDNSNSKYIYDSEETFVNGDDVDWDDRETTYGTWQGNYYRISDEGEDTEYAKGWVEIFGKWYFFNQSGALQTGWIQDGETRYYSNEDGEMQIGWKKPKGSDSWYYFHTNGAMATGWVPAEPGTWYYLNGDGTMQVGWVLDNQSWYFMGIDGKMKKDWQQINGQWYYFYENGHMAANEHIGSYYVNAEGIYIP